MKILCSAAFLIPLIGFGVTINIECKYESDPVPNRGRIYYCNIPNNLDIISKNMTEIETITGDHRYGKGSDDVLEFYAHQKNIQYFPQGLEKFFKNLKLIKIVDCGLKEIHQTDLKPFPRLLELSFFGNDIEVIEEGLFDYNPLLEHISFTYCNLNYIHPDVFDNLNNLKTLTLFYNKCIAMDVTTEPGVREVIQEIKAKCSGQSIEGTVLAGI